MAGWSIPNGMIYPQHLIPKKKYRDEMDFNDLLDRYPGFEVVRRVDKPVAEVFNEVGKLRADCLHPKDADNMSLFMWCNKMRETDIAFVQKKSASNLWPTNCETPPIDLLELVDYRETCTPVFVQAKNIHLQQIPYQRNGQDKEVKAMAQRLGKAFPPGSSEFSFTATAHLHHVPACLNYWHAELRLLDEETQSIKYSDATWKKKAFQTALDELIIRSAYAQALGRQTQIHRGLYQQSWYSRFTSRFRKLFHAGKQ